MTAHPSASSPVPPPAAGGGLETHIPGLDPRLSAAAARVGLLTPTPVQATAIPPLLTGKDAEITAPTGTGKTASYLLPVMQALLATHDAMALVIVPTRELARQVTDMGKRLAQDTDLVLLSVYGRSEEVDRTLADDQVAPSVALAEARLVIATPGRLLDVLTSERLDATLCRHLVLDEADRLLAPEFRDEMLSILARLPTQRQTILVSATLTPETAEFARHFLHRPVQISTVAPLKGRIRQAMIFAETTRKTEVAEAVMRRHPDRDTILFVGTRDEADSVTRILRKRGLPAAALHGRLTQPVRVKAVQDFEAGRTRVLVATDIAARGLDIEHVTQIINLSPPDTAETYLHRIGRTGRAGRQGWALTLCAPAERQAMRRIESELSLKLAVLPMPDTASPRTSDVGPPSMKPRVRKALSQSPKTTSPVGRKGKR